MRIALPANCAGARLEFRIGEEHASLAGDKVVEGGVEDPDAVIVGDAKGFYRLLVDRELDGVSIEGDVDVVRAMLAALPAPVERATTAA